MNRGFDMKTPGRKGFVLGLAVCASLAGVVSTGAQAQEPKLSPEAFEKTKTLYFQRCAGCHGVLRKGATGKSLLPKETKKLGQKRLEKIITIGTEGGMNNFDDIFSKEQIADLATYIQLEPPVPAELSLAEMKISVKIWSTISANFSNRWFEIFQLF